MELVLRQRSTGLEYWAVVDELRDLDLAVGPLSPGEARGLLENAFITAKDATDEVQQLLRDGALDDVTAEYRRSSEQGSRGEGIW